MGQMTRWASACVIAGGAFAFAGQALADDSNGVEIQDGCRVIHQGDRDDKGGSAMSGSTIGSSVTAGNGSVSGSTTMPGQPQTSVTAGGGQVTTSGSENGSSVTVTNQGNGNGSSASTSSSSTSGNGVAAATSSNGDCVIVTH
ncbi:hypothetical protein [Jiella sp. M17.18]|uniref:hypothetical protein n=1 Tax=Jiella sp. M17.18 TaxID=3234247 RepID=UPI0034DF27D6